MKLSEAILLGSVGTGQAFGTAMDRHGNTCAMGAALIGAGVQEKHVENCANNYATIVELFGQRLCDTLNSERCPECYRNFNIPHMNDDHKWTRPQIAAYIANIEARLEQDQTVPVEANETETVQSK